ARQSACLNNCKQIGLATDLYLDSWDETFPNQWWVDKCGEFNCTPARQLMPYLKTTQVFICPSKGRGAPDPAVTGFISYGFNHRFQTQHAKHAGTVNVVYADGHAKNTRPSQLKWGNFWGKFQPTFKVEGVSADTPVASQEMDRAEIEP